MNRVMQYINMFFWGKLIFILIIIQAFLGCKSDGEKESIILDASNYTFIKSLDTLQFSDRQAVVNDKLISIEENKNNHPSLYNYLKGYSLILHNQKDSAISYFKTLKMSEEGEWELLATIQLLSLSTNRTGVVSAEQSEKIFKSVKKAEESNSVFVYKLYDLLAMIYYNNHNADKALEYNEKYFKSHPFKNSDFIRQRYHDISFLLNERKGDLIQMDQHFRAARELALKTNDSTALMRTYEYESQINTASFQLDSATKNMKKYLDFSERNTSQIAFIYSNMGLMYYQNGQIDSAQYYYQKAINWKRSKEPDANTINAYKGMSNVYATKKDYANAYIYLDSMLREKEVNDKRIRDEYVEQLQAEYAVEKKDNEIENLKLTNQLNQRIIVQTRWIIGIGIILLILGGMYIYILFRRNKLNNQNRKLEFENRSLLLEQRLTQMQINPHFIHNAIANLQGLIVQDEKKTANRYLVALSKLIRNILELNRKEFITVSEEIDSLENYLKLQQMRMKNGFSYEIDTTEIDADAYFLPPMLLQPFIENAIEHGFSNLDYPGKLTLRFRVENQKLHIVISDNGNKAFAPGELQPNKKSLSQTIIQERLDLLFNTTEKQAWYEAGKKENVENGYEVNIYLPLMEP